LTNNEKMQSYVKMGHVGGHVTHFWNFGTPHISGMNQARNFKYEIEWDDSEC